MTRDEAIALAEKHVPRMRIRIVPDWVIAAIMEAHATGLERAAVICEEVDDRNTAFCAKHNKLDDAFKYADGAADGAGACAAAIRALVKDG